MTYEPPTDPYAKDEPTYPSAPSYPPPGYGAPPGYGYPPPPPYGYYAPRPTNGFAIAALVLGIVWVYWIGSILAVIFGLVARNQIKERNESGDGMAVAGLTLGLIGLGTLVLFLAFAVVV
jgi:uncharacterized protein DUF4190